MANPAFRAFAKTTNTPLGTDNSGGALNVATHLPDDLLVLFLCVGSNTTSVPTPTVAGWTLRESYTVDVTGGSSDIGLFIYTKRAASGSESATLSLSANAAWIAHILSYANASYETTSTPNTYPNNPNGLYDPTQPTWGPYTNSVYQVPWAAITTGIFGITYPSGYTQITEDDGVGTNGDEIGLKVVQKLVSTPEDPSTFGANFDIGGLAATTVIRSLDDDPVQTGYCPKHMKGCCEPPTCLIGSDPFNRPNENPVTGEWVLRSGEWEVRDNTLQNITEGNLITSLKQSIGPDSINYAIRMTFDLIGEGPWKVICRYVSESDYDYIEYTKIGGSVFPAFYRQGAGLVMDSSTHPLGAGFTWDIGFGSSGGVPQVSICYSTYEWTTQPSTGSGADWTYCEGNPEEVMPPGWGLVGFRLGDFDNFFYYRHWESFRECPYCSCFCDDGLKQKCIPEQLTLTLTPIVNHADCPGPPPTLIYTLYQTQPDATPTTPFEKSPRKFEWFSEPFSGGDAGVNFWWRLVCNGGDDMELIFLESPSQIATVSPFLAQFQTQDGPAGGSVNFATECDPIRWDFGTFEKIQLQIGSGGPFWCSPFAAIEYSVKVEE